MVALLLANGANKKTKFTKGLAFRKAAKNGFKQTVQVLIDHNTEFTGDQALQRSLLMKAAQSGQPDMVEFLLS